MKINFQIRGGNLFLALDNDRKVMQKITLTHTVCPRRIRTYNILSIQCAAAEFASLCYIEGGGGGIPLSHLVYILKIVNKKSPDSLRNSAL